MYSYSQHESFKRPVIKILKKMQTNSLYEHNY